jgi:hypothetical protein
MAAGIGAEGLVSGAKKPQTAVVEKQRRRPEASRQRAKATAVRWTAVTAAVSVGAGHRSAESHGR